MTLRIYVLIEERIQDASCSDFALCYYAFHYRPDVYHSIDKACVDLMSYITFHVAEAHRHTGTFSRRVDCSGNDAALPYRSPRSAFRRFQRAKLMCYLRWCYQSGVIVSFRFAVRLIDYTERNSN